MSRFAAGSNLLVTVLLAPGIVAHEFAHELGCRLVGVRVLGSSYLDPVSDAAYVDHETVESFGADAVIAFAPLVVNSVLAATAFVAAGALDGTPAWPVFAWVGGTLALTAFPSHADTDSLLETAWALPWPVRPLGVALAVPLRLGTVVPGVGGFYGFFWMLWLYATVTGTAPP
ncbi:hypothetical protein [Haloarchaeobius sp. HRN-SO-5]|uniref:hypothetical protein n=1 Tax=Haloarchaeobius sp. HRN-SO-5 TaxID=3446118 RepID=UPI003EB84330